MAPVFFLTFSTPCSAHPWDAAVIHSSQVLSSLGIFYVYSRSPNYHASAHCLFYNIFLNLHLFNLCIYELIMFHPLPY